MNLNIVWNSPISSGLAAIVVFTGLSVFNNSDHLDDLHKPGIPHYEVSGDARAIRDTLGGMKGRLDNIDSRLDQVVTKDEVALIVKAAIHESLTSSNK